MQIGISPSLNYGEAKASESLNDFIHKMKICLKELRESFVAIKIIQRAKMNESPEMAYLFKECNELVAIFVKSIHTAQKRKITPPS